jgi:hypothetical protein
MQPCNEIGIIGIKDVLLPDGTAGGIEVILKIPVGIN